MAHCSVRRAHIAMDQTRLYLDYNAGALVRPEVAAAVGDILGAVANPSSVHAAGRKARAAVEDSRLCIAECLGADPGEVVFTSGGSEANVTALRCSGAQNILASAVEHDSVLAAASAGAAPHQILSVDPDGLVDLSALDEWLSHAGKGALVSVMLANNETGVIQPVAQVVERAHRHGATVHCDAVQAFGKLPVNFASLGVDYLSVSGHKIGGLQGAGALLVRDGAPLQPLLHGGGQEFRRRAGTENVPGIVGFAVAARLAQDGLGAFAGLRRWRDDLETRIRALADDAQVFGSDVERLANTSCITMPGVSSDVQVMGMDLEGICVSAGAACSSGKVQASHVLSAMGVDQQAATESIRISLGWDTREEDIDRLVGVWRALYERNRSGNESSAA